MNGVLLTEVKMKKREKLTEARKKYFAEWKKTMPEWLQYIWNITPKEHYKVERQLKKVAKDE